MGAFLSAPQRLLNLLLPFTNPSTPLLQDLIHTLVLCGTLYFAPQLAEVYNAHRNRSEAQPIEPEPALLPHAAPAPAFEPDTPAEDIPIAENLVLEDDGDGAIEPPPLAPTPPPGLRDHGPADWNLPPDLLPDEDVANRPGPAADRPRATPANRVVGAKKAKSLARKDQRRAYHEFHRQEAELRRQREAEGKEEREAALAAEKARRAEVEREIQERERAERERKKEEERRDMEAERERRERVVQTVREDLEQRGAVDLVDLAWDEGKDRVWVEKLVRASGLLSQTSKEGSYSIITGGGWLVRVDKALVREAFADAVSFGLGKDGKVSYDELAGALEKVVRTRVNVG